MAPKFGFFGVEAPVDQPVGQNYQKFTTPPKDIPQISINAGAPSAAPGVQSINAPIETSKFFSQPVAYGSGAGYGGVQGAMLNVGGAGANQLMAATGATSPTSQGQTAKNVASGLGAGSALLSFIPVVGPVLSGLAAVGSVIASWWGMSEAEKAQKKAAAEETRRYEAESRKEQQRYEEGMALTRTKMAMEARAEQEAGLRDTQKVMAQERALNREYEYREKELEETKKTNRINQATTMVAGFLRFANSPENRAAYAQIWRR